MNGYFFYLEEGEGRKLVGAEMRRPTTGKGYKPKCVYLKLEKVRQEVS